MRREVMKMNKKLKEEHGNTNSFKYVVGLFCQENIIIIYFLSEAKKRVHDEEQLEKVMYILFLKYSRFNVNRIQN